MQNLSEAKLCTENSNVATSTGICQYDDELVLE
jgi:hypothetical protein